MVVLKSDYGTKKQQRTLGTPLSLGGHGHHIEGGCSTDMISIIIITEWREWSE